MKGRIAIALLSGVLLVDMASVSSAQQTLSAEQQEYAERLRRSRLVGSDDALAIEMPDGEVIPLARRSGCLPPVSRGSVIKVDCSLSDGPTHYFDEGTRAIIESCSFWFPEPKRCPPKQWPVEVEGCDGTVPLGISGTWRFHALPGASGFYPVNGGWAMTLDEGSISFDFYGFARLERSYTIVESDERRYTLEISDATSAKTAIEIELASCGMFVEADAQCDALCENLAREFGTPTDAQWRAIVANSLGDDVDTATLERVLKDIPRPEQPPPPQPLFPERAYFRAVASD